MSKNVRLNIKIIKALTVGISATMVAQPLGAFASTPATGTGDAPDTNTTTATETTETQATAEAQEAATAASAAVADYETAVEAGADVANSIDSSATTSDFAEALEDLNNDLTAEKHHDSGQGGSSDDGGATTQNTDNGSGSQTDNGSGNGQETEPDPEGQTGNGFETEPEPEGQTDGGSGSQTDNGSGNGQETEPEPEGGSDSGQQTEPEPDEESEGEAAQTGSQSGSQTASGEKALSSAIGTASQALGNIAGKETEMQATISAADRLNAAADELADAGDALAEKAEGIAGAAAEVIDGAVDSVSEGRQALSGAKNETEANQAFENINSAVSAADAAVESAEAQLIDIQTEFNSKKAEYDEKAAAYVELTEQLEAAKEAYEELKGTAGDAAAEAAEKLGVLTSDVAELKAAAEAAQAEYQSAGFGLISEIENEIAEKIANGKTPKWTSNDPNEATYAKLFETIVEFYYVPEVEGAEFVSAKWSRFSGYFEDGSTYGNVLNYCTVKYKDADGNVYTKLLNYKVADENSQKGKNGEYSGLVIFEKTEHIVYGGEDLTEDEIKSLDAGEVLEKNGDIIVKNSKGKYVGYNTEDGKTVDKVTETDTENLVIEDGTKVVDILEETETASDYSFDKKKNTVTQTVTADVATTTYTGASLEGHAATLESVEAARTEYISAMQSKINALKGNEEICIGEGESAVTYKVGDTATDAGFESTEAVTSYTVSGSFVESYTKDYSKKYNNELDYSNGIGLGILGIGENHSTARLGDPTDNGNGGVTVEYGKLVKADSQSFSWLGNLLSGNKDEEALKAELTEKFAAEGKVFAGIDGWNWSIGTADIYIVDAQEATEATAATEEAAYQAFEDAIRASITDGGQIYSTKTSVTENKSYGYQLLNYFIKTVAIENKIISETTWNQVAETAKTQYKNDNWYSGNILLSEYDQATGNDFVTDKGNGFALDSTGEKATSAFRDKLEKAADTTAKYADLITKLSESEQKVSAAEDAISALKASISRLKFEGSVEELAGFEASLKTAQDTLADAKAGRDTLLSQIAAIRTELNNKIAELNPTQVVTEDTSAPTVTVDEEAPVLAATPATGSRTTAPAANIEAPESVSGDADDVATTETDSAVEETQDTTEDTTGGSVETVEAEGKVISDEDTAKASGPAVAASEEIDDEDSALASMPESQKKSWWWALVILIFGTAGTEMYRRHLEKKKVKGQVTTSSGK